LYDTGANTSIIQKKIFNQIIKDDVTTQVVEYKGKLKSYTTEIKTFGQILLNQCTVESVYKELCYNVMDLITIKKKNCRIAVLRCVKNVNYSEKG
jgi:hypothetical protein